jgi:DHA1 family bicyclomycin/chloramphenicol resistance-like MFS transporter
MAGNPPGNTKLLLLLGAISLLAPFSIDMYLPALPAIAADLAASPGAVQLTLPAFFVGMAMSQLLFGSLADHFGRRPPLLVGLGLSAAAALGCAFAHTAGALTIWRVLESLGVGSASVIPRAVVRDRFPVADTARAMSLLGLITGMGPILAPQIGGLLLEVANWRFLFWLLTAHAALCLLIAFGALEESIPAHRATQIGPKLWLQLLTDRRFLRYSLPANLIQSSVFAYLAGAPFVFIQLQHLSPRQFAWLFGVNALGLLCAGRVNAYIVPRLGPEPIFRRAMLCTAGLCTVLFAIACSGRGGFWALAIPMFLFVSSLGFNFANGFALTLAPFGKSAGTASALHGTLQFLLAGLGGIVVSALYDGTPRAMTGVMCALTVAGVLLYRWLK